MLGWAIGDAFTPAADREADSPSTSGMAGRTTATPRSSPGSGSSRAVAALPDRDRVVMRMRFVDGCEAREIAAALGITANAVHQALHRGRAALRAAWVA